MNQLRRLAVAALSAAILLPTVQAYAWGWEAHKWITRAAVDILPEDMQRTVRPQREALAEHAPDPDLWRDDPDERHRHWIDLELADPDGPPFARLPRDYDGAVRAFGTDSLRKIGVLPWRIESYFAAVTESMRRPSDSTWIHLAALGHYVADATQPMHTTVNYDGQLTGNRGIHFRFEWWMLEQHRDRIRLNPRLPVRVDDPLAVAWHMILDAQADIDTLLRADTDVRRTFREPVLRGDGKSKADPEFDARLWERVGHLAVERLNFAAQAVAGYWYEAWLRAGKPDLRAVPAPPPPPSEQ